MDPDIPRPSIETEGQLPFMNRTALDIHSAATATPLPPSSPMRSPYKTRSPSRTSSPRKPTRSPSSASSYSDRQTTPALHTRRSSSNLNVHSAVTPSRTQFRRTSSNLNPSSPVASFKSAMSSQEPPQRKVLTPSTVAKDYFKKDLNLHKDAQSRVAVIVHDSCYGHRFSRPRTSKAALSSIVERPERIHATLLGASTAYVRLGGRHAEGRHPPHPERQDLSSSVPFEIRRTTRFLPLKNPSVAHVHGSKWMEELQIMCDSAEGKLAMNGKELVRPIGYGKDESGNPLPKLHEGDLYLCSETLSALQGCLGGVCDAVDSVFGDSPTERAFVCIRPPGHHCSSNVPSGFCWLNNVHVGITYGAMNHGLTHAAIIDFDLHHGDGSQAITWDHNRKAQMLQKNAAPHKKTPIGYYSIHDINSFPCEAGDEEKIRNASVCVENAHGQSIWNIHFEPWNSHAEFWKLYQTRYLLLLEKARNFLTHHSARLRQTGVQPKAAIFLSAGFDASEWEMAGMQRHGVNVPTDFYAQFTADVVKMSQEEDLGVNGRVISVLEGGYSDRALTSGVLSHLCGLVDEPSVNMPVSHNGGLAASMVDKSINGRAPDESTLGRYDPSWWSSDELEIIEAIVLGNMPPPPKVSKDKNGGNYSSPTHASTNRMTEVAKERRSLSAQLEARLSLENEAPPPPPDVDWAVASYELSRLLIPSDRQTLSCRHDELNAEATRARKDRHSGAGLAAGDSMQLRERRPKPPPIPSHVRSSSRSSTRRTTIASVSDLPDPSMAPALPEGANGRPRRRSSASSSIMSAFQGMRLDDEADTATSVPPARTGARPGSVAPPTAMTAKPPVPRKPKATVAAKPPVKPRTSPRKPKAASRPGSSSSDRANAARVPPEPLVGVSRPLPPSRQESEKPGSTDDMDSLTNGMKKVSIKLKMPPAEEQAVKEKKTEEPSKATNGAKVVRKPAVPRTVKPKPAPKPTPASRTQSHDLDSKSEVLSASSTKAESASVEPEAHEALPAPVSDAQEPGKAMKSSPVRGVSARSRGATDPEPTSADAELTAATFAFQSPVLPTPATAYDNPANDKENAGPQVSDMKTADQNSIVVAAEKAEQAAIVLDMPPPPPQTNGNPWSRPITPNKKTKDDLPKFTSSSPIPFSKNSRPGSAAGGLSAQQQTELERMKQEEQSVWDIPETPAHRR